MEQANTSIARLRGELATARQRIATLEAALAATGQESPGCGRTNAPANFYLTILDDAPALIWRAGRDAKCDWFNKTWLSFTGRSLERELGDGWAEGVHPDDFQRCLETYLHAFHARQFFEMEYRLLHHSGGYRWILDIGCPFTEPDGAFGGYIGYCFDVTQRRQDEQFRRDVDRMIRHDIKAPLNSLKTLAQALFSDVQDAEVKPLLPRLHHAIGNVVNLVDSTEKILQIERGEYAPPAIRLDLRAICRNTAATLAPQTEAGGPRILFPESGPEAAPLCHGEEVLIETLLTNLVKNAVEASLPGAAVTVRTFSGPDAVGVAVHNQGVIPEAIRDVFFEKGVTLGKAGGAGLGTYSAAIIAKAHGGRIDFTTSETAGTTVTVTLPPAHRASREDA